MNDPRKSRRLHRPLGLSEIPSPQSSRNLGPNRGETAPKPLICIGVGTEASKRSGFVKAGSNLLELGHADCRGARAALAPLVRWHLRGYRERGIFGDVAATVPERTAQLAALIEQSLRVYEMLFYGSNLPAITPPSKQYIPNWTSDDTTQLRNVLSSGASLFH